MERSCQNAASGYPTLRHGGEWFVSLASSNASFVDLCTSSAVNPDIGIYIADHAQPTNNALHYFWNRIQCLEIFKKVWSSGSYQILKFFSTRPCQILQMIWENHRL
jgi:hypothetical protein